MQKPSERHKLTSDNKIIKFKKPVHDPFNYKPGSPAMSNPLLAKITLNLITCRFCQNNLRMHDIPSCKQSQQ